MGTSSGIRLAGQTLRKIILFALVFVIGFLLSVGMVHLLFGFQDGHEGQPALCNNHHGKEHPCACQRATKCHDDQSEQEDSKCQTYCRKTACKCIDPCAT